MTAIPKRVADAATIIETAREDRNGRVFSTDIAMRLDRAGLLVTDLHKRALEACERMAQGRSGPVPGPWPDEVSCYVVGRESLAAKQPPKRPRDRRLGSPPGADQAGREEAMSHNTPDNCYLDKSHSAHDLLGPGESCKACGFMAPAAPRELAEAVARLERFHAVSYSIRGGLVEHPLEDDIRLILAALAEAQRERDEAAKFFTVPLPEPGSDMGRVIIAARLAVSERDAAQAEAAKLREALVAVKERKNQVCAEYETCTHDGCRASYEAFAIADAAPPSTTATPEGK
jgi:hypothetical protein